MADVKAPVLSRVKAAPNSRRRFAAGLLAWPILAALGISWLRSTDDVVIRDGWILSKDD